MLFVIAQITPKGSLSQQKKKIVTQNHTQRKSIPPNPYQFEIGTETLSAQFCRHQ